MKKIVIVVFSIISVLSIAFADDVSLSVNAILKDGSTLKGEFLTKKINGSTFFSKTLALDSQNLHSLSFSNTNGEAKVELVNGDKFAIKVVDSTFAVKSLLGELKIPRENIRVFTFSLSKRSNLISEKGLVFYCTFDDETTLSSPNIGPTVKLELGRLRKNSGINGSGSLFVNPGIAGAEIRFPKGFFAQEGTIEFWANMASGKTEFTTGGDPRFFIMHTIAGNEIAHLQFASNDGCGNSGLGCSFGGLRTQTNSGCSYMMPYSDVFKGDDYNGWHHYALVWTSSSLSLFIDGKKACQNEGPVNVAAIEKSEVIFSIPLSRTNGKSFNNKSAFFMDELKIWNYPKEEFNLK